MDSADALEECGFCLALQFNCEYSQQLIVSFSLSYTYFKPERPPMV